MKRVYDMKEVYTSFLEHLNETLPEELEKDLEEFDHWNNIGPTVEEYFNYIDKNDFKS